MKNLLITGTGSFLGTFVDNYLKDVRFNGEYHVDCLSMRTVSWKKADLCIYDSIYHVVGIAHAGISGVSDEVKRKYYAVNRDMAEAYLWIKGMLNGCIDPVDRKSFESFMSMSEIIDYGKRMDTGMVNLPTWLKDFKEAKSTYYYHKDDLGPWEYVADKWDQYK